MNHAHRQSGSIIAIVLVIALVGVLFLLWQTGRLGSASDTGQSTPKTIDSAPTATSPPASQDASPDESRPGETGGAEQPFTIVNPNRELTAGEQAAIRAKNFKPQGNAQSNGNSLAAGTPPPNSRAAEEAAAIDAAAAELLSRNTPDFSACRVIDAADKALECAAAEQTRALNNAFKDHNARRESGDSISLARGGKIMQHVITAMQDRLAPFVKAAESP